jgi:hypothetical protein
MFTIRHTGAGVAIGAGLGLLLLAHAARAQMPAGHPPVARDQGAVPTPAADSGTGKAALLWTVPEGWISRPPASAMRKAQYDIPGPGGVGECVVFYFGPGQGGDPAGNAQRWAAQFHQPDGRPPEQVVKTVTLDVNGMQVLRVEITGTYVTGGAMGGVASGEKPAYMLLGAVAQGADANWFFKLTGPEATVRAQLAAFDRLIQSMRRGS